MEYLSVEKEARRHNENLPGMGGVYNYVNLNVYHYGGNNPLKYVDPTGKDDIVISGGIAGYEKHKYQFIEKALKAIQDLKNKNNGETISWLVFNQGYSEKDIENFKKIAKEQGINFIAINTKYEFINYLNCGNVNFSTSSIRQSSSRITDIYFFAHGYVNELAFGHGGDLSLNFTLNDITKFMPNAFNNQSSIFYSCNTATSKNNKSFAEIWFNKFGGSATAFVGKTWYSDINTGNLLQEAWRQLYLNREYGFNPFGSINYPIADKGAYQRVFY